MIEKNKNPVEWSMLMEELEDAKEHLEELISEIENDAEYQEANLRIDLGHVYSHLNRVWYRRNKTSSLSEQDWLNGSQFPTDLLPT